MCWTFVKLTETKFAMINTLKTANKSVVGLNWPTFYVIFETTDDPTVLKAVNGVTMHYSYVNAPMRYDARKLMFVYSGVASHGYTFNDQTNRFELTWEIDTPNIVAACHYNGIYWWVNKTTSELNYEIEGNVLRVEARFEQSEVQLESALQPVDTRYYISVYDADDDRVAVKVKLTCKGVITFTDGSTTKDIVTNTGADYAVGVKVTNAGESFIVHTLLQS